MYNTFNVSEELNKVLALVSLKADTKNVKIKTMVDDEHEIRSDSNRFK